MTHIYKIVAQSLWAEAEAKGTFFGAPVDLADGFIHFSMAEQVLETATKHFAGQADLLLVSVDPDLLGEALRWEPSRGGALFPHLHSALPTSLAASISLLPLQADGSHDFGGLLP